MNISKSKVNTSKGVRPEVRDDIVRISPILFVRDLGRCLGFPLKGGGMRGSTFNFLLDNIIKKLASWKTNMLNMAGRVCLVRSIMASIPSYVMQVFWLPRGLISKLN